MVLNVYGSRFAFSRIPSFEVIAVVAWHAIVLDDCLIMNNGSVGTKNVPIFWAQKWARK